MIRSACGFIGIGVASLLTAQLASAQIGTSAQPANQSLEGRFDSLIDPQEMGRWLQHMAAAPNHVGSAHVKATAEWQVAEFQRFGWDARIETFDVLYPTPIEQKVQLLGDSPFAATLTEPPVAGDSSADKVAEAMPAYVAYQGDGDVTAPLVYVNYGMRDDYEALARMGVSVKGKIVITRYGAGWRGLKPRLAQEHGAVGCILYSDPQDDGYAMDEVYPQGPMRPAFGMQRGSVADLSMFPGDPLTPGVGATRGAKRLDRLAAPTLMKIPTQPISYGDAQRLLQALGGWTAPKSWRGSLPLTYRVGGEDDVRVRLLVKSEWSLKTIYNVVATLKGSTYPDQWVLRGNHRDAWVFGGTDPLSGQIAMMAEIKALGKLAAEGWRPLRTLVYLSWDAEEPGLLGSTEWAEAHAAELKKKAVLYINTDAVERGMFLPRGSAAYQQLVNDVAHDVTDPAVGSSVGERVRAAARVAASQSGASAEQKALAARLADEKKTIPLPALGSGSDYSAFLQHLGLGALDLFFTGESNSRGVYHSAYDTYDHHRRFVNPEFATSALLAKIAGRLVLRIADAELPVQRYSDVAESIGGYLSEVKALASARREAAISQAELLAGDLYRLADDPTKTRGNPIALSPVPHFNFAPLENAVELLQRSAQRFDRVVADGGGHLSAPLRAELFQLTYRLEQAFTEEIGLPGRPWYKNLIYAPGRYTGYEAKTLPGVREAIEEERWGDVDRYAVLTAAALTRYAEQLDRATQLVASKPH